MDTKMYTANGIGYEGFCPEGQWIRFKVPEELGIVYHTGPSNDDDDMSWDVNVKLVEIYDGDITDCLVLFDNSDQNGCDWDSMTEENQNKLLNYLIDNRSELKVDGSGSLNWTENVEQRNLTEWEQELASKYDDYCHYSKDGSLYARDLPLKRPMNNDGTFADDDDDAAVLAFCTFHGTIRVTDYCGEGPITDFSEEFRSRFLEYISDKDNVELPK